MRCCQEKMTGKMVSAIHFTRMQNMTIYGPLRHSQTAEGVFLPMWLSATAQLAAAG